MFLNPINRSCISTGPTHRKIHNRLFNSPQFSSLLIPLGYRLGNHQIRPRRGITVFQGIWCRGPDSRCRDCAQNSHPQSPFHCCCLLALPSIPMIYPADYAKCRSLPSWTSKITQNTSVKVKRVPYSRWHPGGEYRRLYEWVHTKAWRYSLWAIQQNTVIYLQVEEQRSSVKEMHDIVSQYAGQPWERKGG